MQKSLTFDKVGYIVAVVNEFAKKHELSDADAYRYLQRFKAVNILDEEYDIAHTQSFDDMVDNLGSYCRRYGGTL